MSSRDESASVRRPPSPLREETTNQKLTFLNRRAKEKHEFPPFFKAAVETQSLGVRPSVHWGFGGTLSLSLSRGRSVPLDGKYLERVMFRLEVRGKNEVSNGGECEKRPQNHS